MPQCFGDTEIAGDLVADLQTRWDAVGFFRLIGSIE
jgi:hypothetical protein